MQILLELQQPEVVPSTFVLPRKFPMPAIFNVKTQT
jgi:hypothetical protein